MSRLRDVRNKFAHGALLTREEIEELERMKERFEGYETLTQKWGIQPISPREVVRKSWKASSPH